MNLQINSQRGSYDDTCIKTIIKSMSVAMVVDSFVVVVMDVVVPMFVVVVLVRVIVVTVIIIGMGMMLLMMRLQLPSSLSFLLSS